MNTASAGQITTTDGRQLAGDVSIVSKSSLSIASTTVELSSILWAILVEPKVLEESQMARGIVLADGTALAAATFRRADADVVRLTPAMINTEVEVKTARVARLLFGPISRELASHARAGHTGVLLEGGDFVEGDFVGLENGKIKISSVLFGVQSFDAGRQALAVILRDEREPDGKFVVRLSDGSVLPCASIDLDSVKSTLMETPFGAIQVPSKDLIELRAGGERFVPLSRIKPADLRLIAIDRTLTGVSTNLIDFTPRHSISAQAGTAVTFALNGEFESFIARAGVPIAIAPASRVRFIVLVDGKERFRSAELTSVDDSISLAVNLRGAHQLTLQADFLDQNRDDAAVPVIWAEPLLVRSAP